MTKEERRNPEVINMSRRHRIAKGSGLKENEIGRMLNEFQQMRQVFKQFKSMLGPAMGGLPFGGAMPSPEEMAKNMKGMGGFPGGMPPNMKGMPGMKGLPPGGANMPKNPPSPLSFKGGGYFRKKK
jgi:signal recognition particle subunit SRP54